MSSFDLPTYQRRSLVTKNGIKHTQTKSKSLNKSVLLMNLALLWPNPKHYVGALMCMELILLWRGELRSTYMTTYKKQIIDLKLITSSGSFSFSNVTHRLTRPPRQSWVPSRPAVEHRTYDWLTKNWGGRNWCGDNWQTTDERTDEGASFRARPGGVGGNKSSFVARGCKYDDFVYHDNENEEQEEKPSENSISSWEIEVEWETSPSSLMDWRRPTTAM